ncbi:hypothetical protein BV22DRAFT_1134363 [Leucogyrophana mollusca]|uniref:Uncharacterized protein n=1 Tax=Leucogyrophana mollusca TaxID=85980 RepID=A0ACB8AZ99_9AGAM|nr:hypothetical protein BV22DRAFT_1134363 [Leucogyrophana mollusca]
MPLSFPGMPAGKYAPPGRSNDLVWCAPLVLGLMDQPSPMPRRELSKRLRLRIGISWPLPLVNWGKNTLFNPILTSAKEWGLFVQAGDVELTLHLDAKERVTHFGDNGRATSVLCATSPQLENQHPGKVLFAKVFWHEDSRTSKPAILKQVDQLTKGNSKVEGHIPELLLRRKFRKLHRRAPRGAGYAGARKGSCSLVHPRFPEATTYHRAIWRRVFLRVAGWCPLQVQVTCDYVVTWHHPQAIASFGKEAFAAGTSVPTT